MTMPRLERFEASVKKLDWERIRSIVEVGYVYVLAATVLVVLIFLIKVLWKVGS